MTTTNHTGKIAVGILIAVVVVVAYQWYPKYSFTKYTGFKLPTLSVSVKWSSGVDDFFAVFQTTPSSARKFIERPFFGEEWRNDTLEVRLSPTHGNVPFFDLMGYELTRADKDRWFRTKIRKLDQRKYLSKGYAVIVYPDKGRIYITAED